MAGRTFVVVDRESLDEALTEADSKDKIVVSDGAFDALPRLAVDGARWRLNGWTALPGRSEGVASSGVTWPLPSASYAATWAPLPGTPTAAAGGEAPWGFLPSASYAATWAALARVFADTMGAADGPSLLPD